MSTSRYGDFESWQARVLPTPAFEMLAKEAAAVRAERVAAVRALLALRNSAERSSTECVATGSSGGAAAHTRVRASEYEALSRLLRAVQR